MLRPNRRSLKPWRALAAALLLLADLSFALAAPAAQGRARPYEDADIAYGAQVYTTQCSMCHGPQGDSVGGVNLRSGTFRNATTDQDLTRFIRTGSPAGMPAFALDPAEMAGIIAYLRNWNTLDPSLSKVGDAARGRTVFGGKGAVGRCHRFADTGTRVVPAVG